MQWFKVFGWAAVLWAGGASAETRLTNRTLDLPESAGDRSAEFESVTGSMRWSEYFARHPELKGLKLGIQMKGREALAKNAHAPMLPASTEKLITAALALRHLGADHRFENRFQAKFDPRTGTLSAVKFSVSGDPTWSNGTFATIAEEDSRPNLVEQVDEPRFQKLIDSLLSRGVRTLSGPVQIESLRPELDRIPRSAGWRDSWKLECMAMVQTSFQSNGNCGTVAVSAGKARWITHGVRVPLKPLR